MAGPDPEESVDQRGDERIPLVVSEVLDGELVRAVVGPHSGEQGFEVNVLPERRGVYAEVFGLGRRVVYGQSTNASVVWISVGLCCVARANDFWSSRATPDFLERTTRFAA